ncbi:MAG: hypothetical protein GY930_17005 [bacterium]|nr:hypothetical protein [bacterium]
MLRYLPSLLLTCLPSQAKGQAENETPPVARSDWGLAESTRQMLVQRCGDCHNPDSDNRKARRSLPDIADMATLREDYLVPGTPIDSELYFCIVDGDMPPARSDVAPPSKQEMALLHAWIAGGAESPSNTPEASRTRLDGPRASPALLLARSHPIWVHFPLALIPAAFLAAALARLLRKPELDLAAAFCAALALPAAIFAVASGWLHAGESVGQDGVEFHRWLGVATLVTCGAAVFLRRRKWLFLMLMGLSGAIVAASGHVGGRLTYGSDFFPW